MKTREGLLACALLLLPAVAPAHSFGKIYNLPVPFWLYAWGAAAALVLSFVVVAYFLTQPREAGPARTRRLHRAPRLWPLQVLSGAALLLCIVSGLIGSSSAYLNINMTLFWIVFVLGYAYLTALVGDLYPWISPWHSLATLLARPWPRLLDGRWSYPDRWGVWPAFACYVVFIWCELFGGVQPLSLAWMLIAYGALTLLGCWAFGAAAWLRNGELFAVFLRLIGKAAPLQWVSSADDGRAGLRLRWPFAGLLQDHAAQPGELVFVLFMLSSTAFDGLHGTALWSKLFWVDVRGLLAPWLSGSIVQDYALLRPLHLAFETLGLLLSPLVYLLFYLACIDLARRMGASTRNTRDLARYFAYTLLPIALVYNVTHYYTLIITQGLQILRLLSDPFGWGWNLLGTAGWLRRPVIPAMGWVWHTQVALILLGHIVSVALAHREALRLFETRRRALLSQLPMLLMMVGLTVAGLWILAQPIAPAAR